jgi:hypothetical protein
VPSDVGTRSRLPVQLSFDLGEAVQKPAPRRRMRPWEVERAKLKSWQRERRRADSGPPWLVADAWPRFAGSLAHYRLIRRVEREVERCGC